jgi:hypothetical protein
MLAPVHDRIAPRTAEGTWMSSAPPSTLARLLRNFYALCDSIGMRPLGLGVFLASAFALLQLAVLGDGAVQADAVATARPVDHPSRASSFVTAVFVELGAHVEVGEPLVELSPYFIDQRIARLEVEIEQLTNKSKLAQASLVVEEQRFVAPGLRSRPNRPSLEHPTAEFYAKQLEVIETRRALLLEDRKSLTIRSSFAGRVASLAWLGASIAEGASVAAVLPEHAEEIVAYLPPTTALGAVETGATARILNPPTAQCRAPARVLRLGAAVELAPGQLGGVLRLPVHGTPVHVSMPIECELGIGQVVSLEFTPARTS